MDNETEVRLTPAQAKAEGVLIDSIVEGFRKVRKQIEDEEADHLEYLKNKHLAFGYTCPGCGQVYEDMVPIYHTSQPKPGEFLRCDACKTDMVVLKFSNGIMTAKKIPKKENDE